MLYPKNKEQELSQELFKNPSSEYRGTPFWAWNCKLDKATLLKQLEQLKEMGMGGAHIHSRTGMATDYLSEEFMELVKASNEKLKQEDMLCWLYDEDRWPSGAAGGLVTKDEKFRGRFLVFSPECIDATQKSTEEFTSSGRAQRNDKRTLLGRYEVLLSEGYLIYYKKLEEGEELSQGGKLWRAYIEISGNNPWFNNQAYVNTLDKKAIERFIQITHENYYKKLGEDFGKSIPAIFTDEPQFTHKETLGFGGELKDIILPYTDDFDITYYNVYGESILPKLPELFWELIGDEVSVTRYRYHDHISERFTEAFSDTIGEWCREHGIMLTGHMMEEPSLGSQTKALGEAMRSYRSFQLPGIDMLCDWREFSTAKQAQSASSQYGREGVLSELYGVTNWDFDFRGHKLGGDWQAALGVTVRVHHLTWVSMGGEAKRDYPASIGYQSPWYKEYPMIEDHFSRLNTALTRGHAKVRVGVIHPVESYWLHFGPLEQTAAIREELEENFKNITEWLLFGLVDFHFISESLFPSLTAPLKNNPIKVGEMEYEVIIVPGNETLRATTVERLEAFKEAGGRVIFLGEPAKLVDAQKSDRVIKLAQNCEKLAFSRNNLLTALKPHRDVEVRDEEGVSSNNLFYQMRSDGEKNWLFICHVNKMKNPDIPSMERISIKIRGIWKPEIYDTLAGEVSLCTARIEGDSTLIEHEFSAHDSLLLCLTKGTNEFTKEDVTQKLVLKDLKLEESVEVSLSEPNVLVLDIGEYRFDDGIWQPREELLRIDNNFRRKLGIPLRSDAIAQPWVITNVEPYEHKLSLKFNIHSEIELDSAELALENVENTRLLLNGVEIEKQITGWYVDECINKVKLPKLPRGISELILIIDFNSKTNVEWCYLLGDFGVVTAGSYSSLVAPVRTLHFGDWTKQGLPFYAGNVTYHCKFNAETSSIILKVPQFRNPLLAVAVDEARIGRIAFAPYSLIIENLKPGTHTLDVTAYGNRVNTFGTLHNCNHTIEWYGPDAWRTSGDNWAYEYQLKATGILKTPQLLEVSKY